MLHRVYVPNHSACWGEVLVFDLLLGLAYGVDTEAVATGAEKWKGVAVVGTKVRPAALRCGVLEVECDCGMFQRLQTLVQ